MASQYRRLDGLSEYSSAEIRTQSLQAKNLRKRGLVRQIAFLFGVGYPIFLV